MSQTLIAWFSLLGMSYNFTFKINNYDSHYFLSLFLGTSSGNSTSVNVEQQTQVTAASIGRPPITRYIITDDTGVDSDSVLLST